MEDSPWAFLQSRLGSICFIYLFMPVLIKPDGRAAVSQGLFVGMAHAGACLESHPVPDPTKPWSKAMVLEPCFGMDPSTTLKPGNQADVHSAHLAAPSRQVFKAKSIRNSRVNQVSQRNTLTMLQPEVEGEGAAALCMQVSSQPAFTYCSPWFQGTGHTFTPEHLNPYLWEHCMLTLTGTRCDKVMLPVSSQIWLTLNPHCSH